MTSPKAIKYLEIRIDQLNEELDKNSSDENKMIFAKAIDELYIVLDLLKRTSVEPCSDCDPNRDPYPSEQHTIR